MEKERQESVQNFESVAEQESSSELSGVDTKSIEEKQKQNIEQGVGSVAKSISEFVETGGDLVTRRQIEAVINKQSEELLESEAFDVQEFEKKVWETIPLESKLKIALLETQKQVVTRANELLEEARASSKDSLEVSKKMPEIADTVLAAMNDAYEEGIKGELMYEEDRTHDAEEDQEYLEDINQKIEKAVQDVDKGEFFDGIINQLRAENNPIAATISEKYVGSGAKVSARGNNQAA